MGEECCVDGAERVVLAVGDRGQVPLHQVGLGAQRFCQRLHARPLRDPAKHLRAGAGRLVGGAARRVAGESGLGAAEPRREQQLAIGKRR